MGQCVKIRAIHFRSAFSVCYTLKRHIHIRPVYLRAILFFFLTDWWTKWVESHREREDGGGSGTQGSKQMPQRGPSQSILRKNWVCLWGLGRWGFQIKRKAAGGPENGFTILSCDTLLSSLLENSPAVEPSESPPGRAPTWMAVNPGSPSWRPGSSQLSLHVSFSLYL